MFELLFLCIRVEFSLLMRRFVCATAIGISFSFPYIEIKVAASFSLYQKPDAERITSVSQYKHKGREEKKCCCLFMSFFAVYFFFFPSSFQCYYLFIETVVFFIIDSDRRFQLKNGCTFSTTQYKSVCLKKQIHIGSFFLYILKWNY